MALFLGSEKLVYIFILHIDRQNTFPSKYTFHLNNICCDRPTENWPHYYKQYWFNIQKHSLCIMNQKKTPHSGKLFQRLTTLFNHTFWSTLQHMDSAVLLHMGIITLKKHPLKICLVINLCRIFIEKYYLIFSQY